MNKVDAINDLSEYAKNNNPLNINIHLFLKKYNLSSDEYSYILKMWDRYLEEKIKPIYGDNYLPEDLFEI